MKIKKSLILVILIFICELAIAQQLPYYSQYMFNDYFLNPAVAGTKEANIASLSMRMQWVGLQGSPRTQTAAFHGPWGDHIGFGGLIFNDRTGPFGKTGLQLTYAYRFQIKGESQLSFGLSGMFHQYVVNKDELKLRDPNDNAVLGEKEKTVAPEASFGIYYYTKKYYVGLSIPQLFENRLNFNELTDSRENKLVRHYFINGGYTHKFSEIITANSSILIKGVLDAPVQVDINAKVIYREIAWLGLSVRSAESVVVMLGAEYNNFILGYSFDATITSIRIHSSGSHEIFLGLKIPSLKKVKPSI